jgi:hypothetical protein
MTATCGCCTGTIGACTEGCCCAACTPAPGGRTRDVREEIARALMAQGLAGAAVRDLADTVLAVPAVADALAAVERVRAVTDALDTTAAEAEADGCRPFVDARVVVEQLRRALDGEP